MRCNMQRPPIDPRPGDKRPPQVDDAGDVLARVYALILTWPTTSEKEQARRQMEGATERGNEK
jgi:hypothetical protein